MIDLIDINKTYENIEEKDFSKFIITPEKTNKDLKDFLTGKIKQGYKLGIEAIDNHFAMKKNEYYVLTGKKGSGKTTINQALQLMYSIVHGLIWVVAFQENSLWAMKLNYMNYILCDYAKDCLKTNPDKFNKASEWIDKHFIFLKVDTVKEAIDTTKYLIKEGTDVHGLFLDPINSFKSGFQDTGNGYADGVELALQLLKFSKNFCSVHISQHPSMSGQRQDGAVTSYQGEGGWHLNKADFTYVIHREKGSSANELIIENVRNKHTGGAETDKDNPVIIDWLPTSLNVRYLDGGFYEKNIIQKLLLKHNIFDYKNKNEDLIKYQKTEFDDLQF